ncbi:NAD-dependent epimerase/dehydratase family protein, partial [Dellaglioa algida]
GANSYIGHSFLTYARHENMEVDEISVHEDEWKHVDFGKYDSVIHVAAIVHSKRQTSELYYKINRDLSLEVAKKAKKDGVSQFIFLSSMSVYGLDEGSIDAKTIPKPKNDYGKSKLAAEKLLLKEQSPNFNISIIRPPMIYGPGSRGNYNVLRKIALMMPILPEIENRRSMLYIDNFLIYLQNIIVQNSSGIVFPQNNEYSNTSEMMRKIRLAHGKKAKFSKMMGRCLLMAKRLPGGMGDRLTKAFGTLYYSNELATINIEKDIKKILLDESILRTERDKK